MRINDIKKIPIVVFDLVKDYGNFRALDGISFEIDEN